MSNLNKPNIIIFRVKVKKKTENCANFVVFLLNLVNFGLRKLVKLPKFIKKLVKK